MGKRPFWGSLRGEGKALATRGGSKESGVEAHIRGWDFGCRTTIDFYDGKEVVRVYRTTGSNGHGHDELLMEFDNG